MHRFLSSVGARPWLAGVLVFLGLSLASTAWAVATPLGASPDEPSHIIKAASVVRGEFLGASTKEPATTTVTVPGDLVRAATWPCFAFRPDVTAACKTSYPSGPSGTAATSAGLYNPTYYLLVGWPSLLTDNAKLTVFAMRTIGAVLCSALLAVGFVALRRLRMPFFAGLVTLSIVTPMVLFLNGAVNPNGMEVCAGVALLSLLLAIVRGEEARPAPSLLALTFISGALLVNMRGLSPLWLAIIGIIALLAARKGRLIELFRSPRVWLTLAGLLVASGFALVWIIATNTLNAMGTYPGAGTVSPLAAFVTMLLSRSVDPGFVGVFGWLDTFPPGYVSAVWGALAGGITVLALILVRGRMVAAFIVALISLFIVPAVTQAGSIIHSGYIWQGRYALVAFAAVVITGGVVLAEVAEKPMLRSALLRRAIWTVAVLAASAQLLALAFTIKRYSVGANAEWTVFITHPGWLPPGGDVVWLAALVVGMAIVAIGWRSVVVVGHASVSAPQRERSTGEAFPHAGDVTRPIDDDRTEIIAAIR